MAKIGILGASGFVGAALCERLHFEGGHEFVAFIHSSGNAARIARLPITLRLLDLMDQPGVAKALADCAVVVNCSRGNRETMSRGMANLVTAARTLRPAKFIHVGSMAIYGDDPPPDSATEAGVPTPGLNEYGVVKLRQDSMVLELHRAGVPSYILCPANIDGPYSTFTRGLVERLLRGPLPLVDGGRYPTNLIHVDNLVEAILCAVRDSGTGAGRRYFVNQDEAVSWRELYENLGRRLGFTPSFVDVTRAEVLPKLRPRPVPTGVVDHAKIAMSGEFRSALSMMPAFRWLNDTARATFDRLPASAQQAVRARMARPITIRKKSSGPALDDQYVRVQVRQVYHSPELLRRSLGYQPVLTCEQGMTTTVSWLQFIDVCQAA